MIRVQDVTHRYGTTVAVERVSFTIAAGEIVGFLGPNGAGKTTVLKLLSTYIEPSEGTLAIAGFDTRTSPLEVRARIGYLPEHNALFEGMRVDRLLAFFGRAHGLAGAALHERMLWVVEQCGLADVLAKRVRECSKGYRQRIGLAGALIHDPPVLLLDEPTHGLDPLQVAAFRDFVRALAPGRAILFSSHVLAEVAAISDRVLLLSRGRVVLDQDLAALQARGEREGRTLEELVLSTLRESGPSDTVGVGGGSR